jgi:hypothetical protein
MNWEICFGKMIEDVDNKHIKCNIEAIPPFKGARGINLRPEFELIE